MPRSRNESVSQENRIFCFLLMLWKLCESRKAPGSPSRRRRPGGLLLPALGRGSEGPGRLRGGWPRGWGPPQAGEEGSQAQTNPLSSERLASGTSCRADVTAADAAAAGDSRRAGEPSSPVAGSPPAPYLPPAFPDELTRRERQRQPGPLLQAKCQGKNAGDSSPAPRACSGLDLGAEIQATTSVHAARATGPSAVTLTLPIPALPCSEHGIPAGML